MNFEQAQLDILAWITGFVERPHPALLGWAPCPYARRARLEGKFEIRPGHIDPYTDLQHINIGELDVVAMVYDPTEFEPEQFNQQITAVNQGFLRARDLLALADHPDSPEVVQGVTMNQGTWAIAFVQPLAKLNAHARMVAEKGYYKDWPEDYLRVLFEGREDPRS
jgi:hypothetical protein